MGSESAATILVVDDDPGVRDALHLILDDDYEVVDAADGDQALATLASRKIDLVLLDLVMEHGDGFAVLERRRDEDRNVPIVVLSGLNNAWTAAAAARLGAVDYITKPFDEDELRAVVRDTLVTPVGSPDRARVPREQRMMLVGLGLGVYASMAVLLEARWRVARAETMIDALTTSESSSVSVLVIDLVALGAEGTAMFQRLGRHFANAKMSVIDSRGQSTGARVTSLLAEARDSRRYSARVGSILDHLGTHYVEASVRRLARVIGASPGYLSASFRDEIGLPLKAYMTELRITAAKWLLVEAGDKLDAVAEQVGLHDASHLSRLFVRHAGRRPGAYRRDFNTSR